MEVGVFSKGVPVVPVCSTVEKVNRYKLEERSKEEVKRDFF